MRARFRTSVASLDFAFDAGTEVSVEGTEFGMDVVPEAMGHHWLASGVLEPVLAEMSSTTMRVSETAAFAASKPRRGART